MPIPEISPSRPRLLLVDPDLRRLSYWKENLDRIFEITGDAANGVDAVNMAAEMRPDVALVAADLPLLDGFETTRRLCERPHPPLVLLLADSLDFETATLAMRAGARAVMRTSTSGVEIGEKLTRLLGVERARRDPSLRAPRRSGAGIWCFCGAAGGDRRTSLLLSVAVELQRLGRSVLVVDLDLFFGDVAYYLGLPAAAPDLVSLLGSERFLEPAVLRQHLEKHRSGLLVLKAPSDPEAALDLDSGRVVQAVKGLASLVDHVLVDMPLGQPPRFAELLPLARVILAVGSSRPASVKDLGLLMAALRSRPALQSVPCFGVINDMTDQTQIEGFLKRHGEVCYLIPPPTESLVNAIDRGEPYTRIGNGDHYSQAVRVLTEDLVTRAGRPLRPIASAPTQPPPRPGGAA